MKYINKKIKEDCHIMDIWQSTYYTLRLTQCSQTVKSFQIVKIFRLWSVFKLVRVFSSVIHESLMRTEMQFDRGLKRWGCAAYPGTTWVLCTSLVHCRLRLSLYFWINIDSRIWSRLESFSVQRIFAFSLLFHGLVLVDASVGCVLLMLRSQAA